MSNTKWRRAFVALAHAVPDAHCRWKFLRETEPRAGWLPSSEDLCESEASESCGCPLFHFRELEWFEVSREITWQRYENAPLSRRPQDLEAARAALEGAGKFDLELAAQGLRVFGYRA